jgi:MerR family transcriptional regulator, light-induced transcriptional regulator
MRDDERESGGALHPIGVVARRTGVSLHVLRAWERRYGVVEPRRTAGGQRLYSDADVARLRLLRQLTEGGRTISQVASLPMAELERLAAEDVQAPVPAPQESGAWYRSRCIAAAERLDGDAVHATLMRAVVSLRPVEFMDDVLLPLLREVGELWHGGRLGPAQEHVVSVAARRVVTWLVSAYEAPAGSPVVLVTTVEGEQHEFGALMVNVVALDEGWRVTYLGTSLPAAEVVRAALEVGATLVALSVVGEGDGERVVGEVARIRAALPATVGVVVGGAGAAARRTELEKAGGQIIADAAELRTLLRALQPALGRGGA